MSAPEPQVEKVDPLLVAIDILCVLGMMAVVDAVLVLANYYVAYLIERSPRLEVFMMQPWVAPALIGCGIVVLGGIAALLVFAGARQDPERDQ